MLWDGGILRILGNSWGRQSKRAVAAEREGNTVKVCEDIYLENGSSQGLDCVICAKFDRQRIFITDESTVVGHTEVVPSPYKYFTVRK
jgi:hypothetical protein